MPTLSNPEEYQFGDTGTLLNGDDSVLPFVDITSITGLDNAPIRESTHDMEGRDGGYVDSRFESIRSVQIEGTVYADPAALDTYLDTLKADFAPTSTNQPLYFKTDVEQRVVFGKSQGMNYTKDARRRLGIVDFQVTILCEDPRIYTDTLVTQTVTRSVGSLAIDNDGTRPTPAILTITGSISNPTITHTQSGTVFDFTGYTVASGQSLTIDLDNRIVLQNGVSKRSEMTVTGAWYLLGPGTNNFTFGGSGSSATLKVDLRAAWR